MDTTEAKRWFGTGAHRTRTIEWRIGEVYKTKSNGSCGRYVPTMMAKAECVCGWNEYADDRSDARRRARDHRATITVATTDLAALVMLIIERAIPFSLHAAIHRLDDTVRSASDIAEPHIADLRPILRVANRPWAFEEHPYVPRLIAVVEQTSPQEPIGMSDSVKGWCERLASSHGLTYDEWIQRVAPPIP